MFDKSDLWGLLFYTSPLESAPFENKLFVNKPFSEVS